MRTPTAMRAKPHRKFQERRKRSLKERRRFDLSNSLHPDPTVLLLPVKNPPLHLLQQPSAPRTLRPTPNRLLPTHLPSSHLYPILLLSPTIPIPLLQLPPTPELPSPPPAKPLGSPPAMVSAPTPLPSPSSRSARPLSTPINKHPVTLRVE
jgi:hypothetical protein